jgi:hypothetical protein
MPRHPLRGATAIAGLGITPQGKVYGSNAVGFAVDAGGAWRRGAPGRSRRPGQPGLSWGDMGMPSRRSGCAI